MDQETKQKLRQAGREDLILTHYVLMSGYAGINKQGTILDRRDHEGLIPIPKSSNGTPEPKSLEDTDEDWFCSICDEREYEGYLCKCNR